MAISIPISVDQSTSPVPFRPIYTGVIAFVAALGGLLFGYDWVVIGGAKPFYEVFFHLASAPNSDQLIGWATSCALVGCLLGSAVAGAFSDRFGRRPVLLTSAVLFAASSILTGWAHVFASFIVWRIAGGVAIGLASNVSPIYISEISPPHWRGRLRWYARATSRWATPTPRQPKSIRMPRRRGQLRVCDPQPFLLLPLLACPHRHAPILRTHPVHAQKLSTSESALAPRAANL
jgi:hypothetical protein